MTIVNRTTSTKQTFYQINEEIKRVLTMRIVDHERVIPGCGHVIQS